MFGDWTRGVEKIFCCLINTWFCKIKLNFIDLEQLKLQWSNLRLWKFFSAFNFIPLGIDLLGQEKYLCTFFLFWLVFCFFFLIWSFYIWFFILWIDWIIYFYFSIYSSLAILSISFDAWYMLVCQNMFKHRWFIAIRTLWTKFDYKTNMGGLS